jgi:pantoate--beta-alanine ligase
VNPSRSEIIRESEALRVRITQWREQGHSVGFVPTMGALHEGHLDLVRAALRLCDRVVVSVFVNPRQFAPHEDLARYPRSEARDHDLLSQVGAHVLFAPEVETIYPPGFATSVRVSGPAQGLESDFRPHFFEGVATVVARLLTLVAADVAVFGEKDFQQLKVIERLAADLALPTQITGAPTRRDGHGLALSSRNAYLSDAQLLIARKLNRIMAEAARQVATGRPIPGIEREAHGALLKAGFDRVDYVSVRRSADLSVFENNVADGPARVLVAAWLDQTRLIDNMAVPSPL